MKLSICDVYLNNLLLLQFLLDKYIYYNLDLLYESCFHNCHLVFVTYILDNCKTYKPYTNDDLYFLLEDIPNNRPHIIELLHQYGFFLNPTTINIHCSRNHYSNVEILLKLKCQINNDTLRFAFSSGNLDIVKLINNIDVIYITKNRYYGIYLATIKNMTDIVEYLHQTPKWYITP